MARGRSSAWLGSSGAMSLRIHGGSTGCLRWPVAVLLLALWCYPSQAQQAAQFLPSIPGVTSQRLVYRQEGFVQNWQDGTVSAVSSSSPGTAVVTAVVDISGLSFATLACVPCMYDQSLAYVGFVLRLTFAVIVAGCRCFLLVRLTGFGQRPRGFCQRMELCTVHRQLEAT
jgi:hypothetical protein